MGDTHLDCAVLRHLLDHCFLLVFNSRIHFYRSIRHGFLAWVEFEGKPSINLETHFSQHLSQKAVCVLVDFSRNSFLHQSLQRESSSVEGLFTHPENKTILLNTNKIKVYLIVEHTNVPGKPVISPSVWICHSITPPVEVIIVEGVHSRICTQHVDSEAWTQGPQ